MEASFLERYDDNGEYVQGGVSKFIDTAATKTITMKLRKTQVGQELLRIVFDCIQVLSFDNLHIIEIMMCKPQIRFAYTINPYSKISYNA